MAHTQLTQLRGELATDRLSGREVLDSKATRLIPRQAEVRVKIEDRCPVFRHEKPGTLVARIENKDVESLVPGRLLDEHPSGEALPRSRRSRYIDVVRADEGQDEVVAADAFVRHPAPQAQRQCRLRDLLIGKPGVARPIQSSNECRDHAGAQKLLVFLDVTVEAYVLAGRDHAAVVSGLS